MYYIIRINKQLRICEIVDKANNKNKAKLILDRHKELNDNSTYKITTEYMNSWERLQRYLQENNI